MLVQAQHGGVDGAVQTVAGCRAAAAAGQASEEGAKGTLQGFFNMHLLADVQAAFLLVNQSASGVKAPANVSPTATPPRQRGCMS